MSTGGASPPPPNGQRSDWFDVERWRAMTKRVVSVRRPAERSVVLGSTQPATDVNDSVAASAGVLVHRRCSGGGAVMLEPLRTLWVDAWVPAGDPLADDDVVRASWWVGDWWCRALESLGVPGVSIHRGRATRDALSALVCFAGRGPGEVMVGARKVVGVAQWRCRQGALLQSLAYEEWDPAPLLDLLVVPETARGAVAAIPGAGAGLSDLRPLGPMESWSADPPGVASTEVALLDALPGGGDWEVEGTA